MTGELLIELSRFVWVQSSQRPVFPAYAADFAPAMRPKVTASVNPFPGLMFAT